MKLRVVCKSLVGHPLARREVLTFDLWLSVLKRVQHNASVQQSGHLDFSVDFQTHQSDSLNFENHAVAFGRKTFWEISRALGILSLCGSDNFVDNSQKLMTFSQRILGKHLFRTAVKPTFYDQFVGGETPEEIKNCVKTLTEVGIQPILGSTMEDDGGKRKDEAYDNNCNRIIECIQMSSDTNNDVPMAQLKITGLFPASLLITTSKIFTAAKNKEELIEAIASGIIGKTKMNVFENKLQFTEQETLQNGIKRLKDIVQEAKQRNVRLLIDAEFTYLNPSISLVALAMMLAANDSLPLVWNTYQCYLKNAMKNLRSEIEIANNFGISFGGKIVRGAYITQEIQYALENGQPIPVCDSYDATNENYNSVLNYMLEHISRVGEKCNIIVASHNEESIKFAIQRMKQLNIKAKGGEVHFGQLYGMCDQITYPLATMGYSAYKSIPYGSIEEVIPYLARRAMENRSVLAGCRKEKQMLWKHLKFRLSGLHKQNSLNTGDVQ